MDDEELAAAGVTPRMGHRERTRHVLPAVDLTVDHVPGTSGAGHAAGPLAAVGASTLRHETVDDPVKGQPVVEAFPRQFHEIGHGVGSVLIEHLQLDVAGVRGHDNGRQDVNPKPSC